MMTSEFLDSFANDSGMFAKLIATSDLNAAVPSCPGWQLRDLAIHLGNVYRWAKACIEANEHLTRVELPVPDSLLTEWFTEGSLELAKMLRRSNPGEEVWTFGPHPRLMSFWSRRQAQETSMHLWDAKSALGIFEPIEESLAADGVAEVFEVFLPKQLRQGRMQSPSEGIRIVLSDGRTFDIGENIAGEVTGSASDILLALWHRGPATSLVTDADERIVEAAFARALTS